MARNTSSSRSPRRRSAPSEPKEFEQKTVDLSRVTRVMAGGKRMRFRACVAIGDGKGRVGVGVAKGLDVSLAITKAATTARKHLMTVPIEKETLPHVVRLKLGAAYILLKPAPPGTGVIAGGAVRMILELAGVRNVVAKMLGSSNRINNAYATIAALQRLRTAAQVRALRGVVSPST